MSAVFELRVASRTEPVAVDPFRHHGQVVVSKKEGRMPLIPQQDILVVTGPYQLAKGQTHQAAAAEKLRATLTAYPPCKIVSITAGGGAMHAYVLTAVIETI
jgi:hypothetical protein